MSARVTGICATVLARSKGVIPIRNSQFAFSHNFRSDRTKADFPNMRSHHSQIRAMINTI
ncbi:hypothetical protein [Nostoc sp. CENA543]|uniref:hypothetical protein n=1 Tax=Nostoc sp. CENA543 TaxID=1869241 RepID=UPI0013000B01|nr:hypothetical protein [Nostoc sp. CENA543]